MRELRLAPAHDRRCSVRGVLLRTGDERQGLKILRRAVSSIDGGGADVAYLHGPLNTGRHEFCRRRGQSSWWPGFQHACQTSTSFDPIERVFRCALPAASRRRSERA
jgi:hypothetical protein